MTLDLVFTVLGIWFLTSIPFSMLIACIMLVGPDRETETEVVPAYQKTA
jgi:hypothetical protein